MIDTAWRVSENFTGQIYDVEFDDDAIIAIAEAYMAQMEHPNWARQGTNKN